MEVNDSDRETVASEKKSADDQHFFVDNSSAEFPSDEELRTERERASWGGSSISTSTASLAACKQRKASWWATYVRTHLIYCALSLHLLGTVGSSDICTVSQ